MVSHNMESSVSSFVGRAEELTKLRALVRASRLLTLTGVGGCGKSRLAAEVCHQVVAGTSGTEPPADGVWWVDLGPLTDGNDVARSCAKVLRVPVEPDREPVAALSTRLGNREVLLCLDTCEHLLDGAAEFVDRLLRACPGVRILTTSREPLAVEGEAVWRVPSLHIADAARLFSQRSQLVAGEHAGRPEDPAVQGICERVDRLPLAIELAAAWTRVLTPSQLLQGLDDRFRLLTGGLRRAVPRHQALRASMMWSHNLLAAPEQVVFRRLAVFTGSFDLAGATAVAGEDQATPEGVLTVLARLVDKSLVVAQEVGGEIRYRLLDTVRQFGEEQLAAADELTGTRDRHLDWCLAAAERVAEGLSQDQETWRLRAGDLDANVRAALEWGLQDVPSRADSAQRLAVAMVMAWFLSGQTHQGLSFLQRALDLPVDRPGWLSDRLASGVELLAMISGRTWGTPARDRRSHRFHDGLARARAGLVEAFYWFFLDHARCHEVATRTAERAEDPFSRDFSRVMAAYSLTARERHDDAVALARRALQDSRSRGDRFCMAFAIGVEQYAAMQTGDLDGAVALEQAMVDTIAPLGDYFGVGTLTSNLALALVLAGDLDGARSILRPIVKSVDTAPDVDVIGFQIPMGHACLREGDWEEAIRWFGRALRRLETAGADWTAARCLSGTVAALRQLGRHQEAADLLARGRQLSKVFDAPEFVANLDEQDAFLVAEVDAARAYELHHRALATRRAANMRTFLPDSLDALAALASRDRQSAQTVRVLAASTHARQQLDHPRSAVEAEAHDEAVARLREALGAEFDRAWDEGMRLSLNGAVDLLVRGRGPRDRPESGWSSLTPAELDVVRLIAEGLSNTDIGQRLFMSRSTVKTHLSRVFGKLGVSNRTELAALASTRGGTKR